MNDNKKIYIFDLEKEDYLDQCTGCTNEMHEFNVPISRVLDKLDEYLNRNDQTGALKHLKYWYQEAIACHDIQARLTICNELMGYYRKNSLKEEGLAIAKEGVDLIFSLDLASSTTAGTTFVNAATVYKTFKHYDEALDLYQKALDIYKFSLNDDDYRLGTLYNNMALVLVDLKNYKEASNLYDKALEVLEKNQKSPLEIAITYLNIASLIEQRDGLIEGDEKISSCLDKAMTILEDTSINRDGYYAFVCEKCASVFDYYGYFVYAKSLYERSKTIYAGN